MKIKLSILRYPFIVLLFAILSFSYGQTNKTFYPYWELNANGGLSTFFGDLRQNNLIPASNSNFSEWKFGGGIQFGRQFSPVFGLRLQLLTGEVLGGINEMDRYFESNYYEANLNATINLNNLIGQYNPDRKVNFYLVAGVGATNFNSELKEISTDNAIAYQGYGNGSGLGGRTLETILTGGLGIDYKISDKVSLNFESVTRGMNSDYMDLYEGGTKYDMYNYTSLGLSFRFGHKKRKAAPVEKSVEQTTPQPVVQETKEKPKEEPKEEPKTVKEVEPEIIKEPVVEEKIVIEEPVIMIPEPEYRVQILAKYGKHISTEMLKNKYNITMEIKEDMNNGYYIYSVGSFATYEEARALRNQIRSRHNIPDAFVVAFSKGNRLQKLP